MQTEVARTAAPAASAEEKASEPTHQVAGALLSGPDQVPPSAEERMHARVAEALAGGESLPGGDSVGGSLAQTAPPAHNDRQDPVVTSHFVNDLAGWMVASYRPAARQGSTGRSSVSLRAANARYSVSSSLRSAESDTLKGRASILRYVYSPGMLEALYRMYGARFMDDLEAAAGSGKNPLTQEQTADMFRLYAAQMSRLAAALEAASKVDIQGLVAPIRRASAREKAANEEFGRAYAAHAEARAAGRRDLMDAASDRMTQSARAASQADVRRERARNDAVWALRQKEEGKTLSDADLVFLVEWLGRRNASPEASASAADICRRMADDMKRRAGQIAEHAGTASR